MGEEIEWYPGGYLFLAQSEDEKKKYLQAMKIQHKLGLKVEFLGNEEIKELIPILNTEGIIGATYCKSDGQANPFLVIKKYREGIRKLKGDILTYTEVMKINTKKGGIFSLYTSNAKYETPVVINAGGAWINEINRLAEVPPLPLTPECHEALITEPTSPLFSPMIVSYSPNCYFQQLHFTNQIIGCYTPSSPIKKIQYSSSYEFMEEFSLRILKLIPSLRELRVLRTWVGWYTMTPDGNPIIGETDIKGFWVIGGASGHGFMFGPALGRTIAKLISREKISLPIEEFSIRRQFKTKEELG
jgi:sarcosine oxidase subunit beta